MHFVQHISKYVERVLNMFKYVQISNMSRVGFKNAQNLSSGLVEWSCAVVMSFEFCEFFSHRKKFSYKYATTDLIASKEYSERLSTTCCSYYQPVECLNANVWI